MKRLLFTRVLPTAILCLCFIASGYSQVEAKKYDNPKFMAITYLKFHPGQMQKAQNIIKEYFMVATEKSGSTEPAMVMEMRSGEWDMMICWPISPSDMEWEISPDDAKFRNAMTEVAGSPEKAGEIWMEYMGTIDRSSTSIAMVSNM